MSILESVATAFGWFVLLVLLLLVTNWIFQAIREFVHYLKSAARREPPSAEPVSPERLQFPGEVTTPFQFPPFPIPRDKMKSPGVFDWSAAIIQVAKSGTPDDFGYHVAVHRTKDDWTELRPAVETMMLEIARSSGDGIEAGLEGLVQGSLGKARKVRRI